jgi:hypothetical protein
MWVMGAAFVCLVGAISVRAQAGPPQAPVTTEAWFKNIQVLKGMPIDTFLDVMGMFAASMGDDCTYCHVKAAVTDRDSFAVATPRLQRARQMILMMRNINNANFAGATRVTCFTCHRGSYIPVTAPKLALQYGTPEEDPNVMDFVDDTSTTPEQVLDRYLEALGGTAALTRITSVAAKGTYAGFDTGFGEVPVEIVARAPNQRAYVVHLLNGPSYRVFDGSRGWIAGPDSPAPLITLTSGNLALARVEAMVAFPASVKQSFTSWRVGRTFIDDREVLLVQGTREGLLPVNMYFDVTSNLLVRIVRWNETPLGPVPTQLDYDDYREVSGVRMPFTWTQTQTYMQMTIQLSDVQVNAPVDAARFARPVAVAR